ncbi:WXG100 family type VII secretion target [Streptomyces tendae]
MSSPFEDGIIKIDYHEVANAVENMVQQTRAIDQTITNLDAELNVLRAHWEGGDKEAYNICQTNWNDAVTEMQNLLAGHVEVLNGAQDSYRYTEQKLKDMWESVQVQA